MDVLKFWGKTIFLFVAASGLQSMELLGVTAEGQRPNIVLILCDDLGYGDLACFGNPVIKSPHLDRMAAEGLKLAACYSSSPVCSPSRAGLMTGRNPNRLGIFDWIPPQTGVYLQKKETTVAELLKEAGYRTGHFGKWHLSSRVDGSEPTPGDHGFDHFFYTQNNAGPSHENPVNFVRNGSRVGPLTGNSTTLTMDEALSFASQNKSSQPFFLNIWFHAPHEPVATPEEFTNLYPEENDPTRRVYFGSVSLIDHEVGRLRKYLADNNLSENTLVLFTSDNGPETLKRYPTGVNSHGSPGPFRGMKLHVTEGGLRVPGIACWPGHINAGAVSSIPISNTDFLPTFCELAGRKAPTGRPLDGESFAPLLRGKKWQRRSPLYWQYNIALGEPWKLALREKNWKLLASSDFSSLALFDLEKDPSETNDISLQQTQRVKKMAESMRKRFTEISSEGAAAVEKRKKN